MIDRKYNNVFEYKNNNFDFSPEKSGDETKIVYIARNNFVLPIISLIAFSFLFSFLIGIIAAFVTYIIMEIFKIYRKILKGETTEKIFASKLTKNFSIFFK